MFGDFTFGSIKGLIKDQFIQFMPSRDPCDNSIIQYCQLSKWDTTKYTIHQVCRSLLFVAEILLLRLFKLRCYVVYNSSQRSTNLGLVQSRNPGPGLLKISSPGPVWWPDSGPLFLTMSTPDDKRLSHRNTKNFVKQSFPF